MYSFWLFLRNNSKFSFQNLINSNQSLQFETVFSYKNRFLQSFFINVIKSQSSA